MWWRSFCEKKLKSVNSVHDSVFFSISIGMNMKYYVRLDTKENTTHIG